MRIIETKVYSFSELSESARRIAIESVRDSAHYLDYEWYDATIENFCDMMQEFGIDVDTNDVHFSGFYSQGDGASFDGRYTFKPDGIEKINEYLQILRAIHSYGDISCTLYTKGNYCHSHTMRIDEAYNNQDGSILNDAIGILGLFRDLADELYTALKKEYDYLCSEEAVQEYIETNQFYFTAGGLPYWEAS